MSENRNYEGKNYSQYDSMETEVLEEILRLDAEVPEGEESDVELLLYVMGVLAERNKKEVNGRTALEAYEAFEQDYLPTEEDMHDISESNKPEKAVRWLRKLAACAAVLALVFAGSVTANAFGFDVWESLVRWTKETFQFTSNGQENICGVLENEDLPYKSLQDALIKSFTNPIGVPTWIPEGFELADIVIDENPVQKNFIALYHNGEKTIKIAVRFVMDSNPAQIEKSDDYLEIYEVNGVIYHLVSNYEQMRAAWVNNSFECYISGDLTVEELKLMIDSIEKG